MNRDKITAEGLERIKKEHYERELARSIRNKVSWLLFLYRLKREIKENQ